MPLDRIGKLLYPRLQRWERRRKVNRMLYAILGIIALAATVAWLSFSRNKMGR